MMDNQAPGFVMLLSDRPHDIHGISDALGKCSRLSPGELRREARAGSGLMFMGVPADEGGRMAEALRDAGFDAEARRMADFFPVSPAVTTRRIEFEENGMKPDFRDDTVGWDKIKFISLFALESNKKETGRKGLEIGGIPLLNKIARALYTETCSYELGMDIGVPDGTTIRIICGSFRPVGVPCVQPEHGTETFLLTLNHVKEHAHDAYVTESTLMFLDSLDEDECDITPAVFSAPGDLDNYSTWLHQWVRPRKNEAV